MSETYKENSSSNLPELDRRVLGYTSLGLLKGVIAPHNEDMSCSDVEDTITELDGLEKELNRKGSRRDFFKWAGLTAGSACALTLPGCDIYFPTDFTTKYLILDSGHGGKRRNKAGNLVDNTGATFAGGVIGQTCEKTLAYDILSRMIQIDIRNAKRRTTPNKKRRVIPIIKYPELKYNPRTVLTKKDKGHVVYKNETLGISNKNRKKVINRLYKDLLGYGIYKDNIYEMSIHLNSERLDFRGACAVIPQKELYATWFNDGSKAEERSIKYAFNLKNAAKASGVVTHKRWGKKAAFPIKIKKKIEVLNTKPVNKLVFEVLNIKHPLDLFNVNRSSYRNKLAQAGYNSVFAYK